MDKLLEKKNAKQLTYTCAVCGHSGLDVHDYPFYDRTLQRDSSQYQCDDINACLDRRYNK